MSLKHLPHSCLIIVKSCVAVGKSLDLPEPRNLFCETEMSLVALPHSHPSLPTLSLGLPSVRPSLTKWLKLRAPPVPPSPLLIPAFPLSLPWLTFLNSCEHPITFDSLVCFLSVSGRTVQALWAEAGLIHNGSPGFGTTMPGMGPRTSQRRAAGRN